MTTTARITRNRAALVALNRLDAAAQRQLLPSLSRDALLAVVKCAKNIILERVELDDSQLSWMRRRERDLRRLVAKRTPDRERIRILQKGGFLAGLLAPILLITVGGLASGLINGL